MLPMAPLRPLNRILKRSILMPLSSRMLLLPPPAVLCYCRPQIFPLRPPASFDATTLGPLRMFIFVPRMLCGFEVWIAIHNHRPEPLHLHSGQHIGVLEVVTVADTKPPTTKPGSMCQPPLPDHLSSLQQQQLNDLFKEFSNVFSQGEDDLGCTPLLEHTIETKGPPLHQPYRRQNPAV